MERVRIVFDVDDTICSNVRRLSYDKCEPNTEVINKINHLHDDLGFQIVLYTARGMVSCGGDMERILRKNKDVLEDWLERHDVHYDELVFGKPIADLYVDDRCIDVEDFVQQGFEVLKGGGSGKSIYRIGKLVKKTFGSESETSCFKDWVEDNKSYCQYPRVASYLYDAVFMDYIDGHDLSKELTVYDFTKIVWTIDQFSSVKYNSFNLDTQLEILNKNSGYDECIDSCIDVCKRFLKDREEILSSNASFSHGDMILSNIVKDKRSHELFFVDPRYFRESSSYLLDFAKLRMSLSGYESAFGIGNDLKLKDLLSAKLDGILKDRDVYDVVVGLHLMYVLRLYRYKDDSGKETVKKMVKEIMSENEELFAGY